MGKKQDFLGLELENDQASQLRVIRVIDSLRNKTNSDLLLVTESQMWCVCTQKYRCQYDNFENNQKNSYCVSKYKII